MGEYTVGIDGHRVDADTADLFYNMDDGSRISDAQWDESKRRVQDAEMLDTDPGNPLVTWIPVRDYNGDGGELGTNAD